MTLFRKRRPNRLERLLADFDAEVAARRAHGEMPPRPARQPYRESRFGPDTIPRLFGPMGELDPLYDPCGAPPLETGGEP